MMQVRPRMRLARRRGHRLEYPGHLERDITTTLPGKPAALHVYDVRGRCTMLVLDLDAHERTHAQIARAQADYQAITSLLARMGARYVSDHAHGGRHIYIPLQAPLTQGQAALIVQALAKRYPSLDAGPHLNASDGLITIPGSAHKHGGHRVLDGSLAAAEAVFTHRTPPRVLEALRRELRSEIAVLNDQAHTRAIARQNLTDSPADAALTIPHSRKRVMGEKYAALAQSGNWREYGYVSASEARWAVMFSAANAGMEGQEVLARMQDGRWPGLAAMYGHKHASTFAREWAKIGAHIASERAGQNAKTGTKTAAGKSFRQSDTRAKCSQGGKPQAGETSHDTYAEIRSWHSVLLANQHAEFSRAQDVSNLLVLRSLASFAQRTGSLLIAVGVRAIALDTGLSTESVAKSLLCLRQAPDAWISRVMIAHGRDADAYQLRIPDRYRDQVETTRWIKGKAHSLRAAFQALGAACALVYEAIEHGYGTSYDALRLRTGLSKTALYDAVADLQGWHLIDGSPSEGWQLTSTEADLNRLAERLGVTTVIARRIATYAAQRRTWWDYLERHNPSRHLAIPEAVLELDDEIEQLLAEIRQAPPPPANVYRRRSA
ncbi:hypothetical protein ACUH9Y_08915 [Dermabacteraceae bacterium P13115]